MSDGKKILDVWIVESNTVYKEVPYTVVTDWVQQGRLLDDDRVRPAGSAQWYRLGAVPGLAAFLPRAEPFRVEDEAEALEPVQLDFSWKRRPGDEDDDVDMIPLIDISLVLLIFFMMTAAVGVGGALIDTPQAQYKLLTVGEDVVWVGIAPGPDDEPRYSVGVGDKGGAESYASRADAIAALEKVLTEKKGEERTQIKVSIKAHRKLPYDVVRDTTVELEKLKARGLFAIILAEVSEKEAR